MSFVFQRRYGGPVRALITDLAGTAVDYGSCAPAGAFVELFRRHGVAIDAVQARGPMGLEKKDHIRVLSRLPEVAARWVAVHDAGCTEEDVEKLYREFIPLQLEVLPRYSRVIPGVLEAAAELAKRGVRLGATTGYNREMMETVLREVARKGFVPESAVCASDVAAGRPAPWMNFRCMEALGVFPPEAVVTIGDTVPDIDAGLNAGVWTIGVTRTGNMLGLSEEEERALSPEDLRSRLEAAAGRMRAAGAHFVIEGFAQCLPVIDEIERRLREGGRP